MEIVFVRHGRTAWNAERRFQGQTDIPLDPIGQAQAQALALHLRSESFQLALASDLTRARMTAAAICEERGLSLTLEAELREMHFGEWEGLTWDEIVARWPELANRAETNPRTYTPAGGESWDALSERVSRVIERVTAQLGPDDRALLVSHAGVMHAVVRVMFGAQTELAQGLRFEHASIMRIVGMPGNWRLAAVNEVVRALDSGLHRSAFSENG